MLTSTTEGYTISPKKIWFWQRAKGDVRVARQGYPVTFACLGDTPYRFAVCRRTSTENGQKREKGTWFVLNLMTGGRCGAARARSIDGTVEEAEAYIKTFMAENKELIASRGTELLSIPMAPEVLGSSIERRGKVFYVWWDWVQGPFATREAAECALKIARSTSA